MQKIEKQFFYNMFPSEYRNDIDVLYSRYSFFAIYRNSDTFNVFLDNGEIVSIPYRIYLDESQFKFKFLLSKNQKLLLSCILTRHYDGFIREKYLRNILIVNYWDYSYVAPFILQLTGEYIMEILSLILINLSKDKILFLKRFIKLNIKFYELTKSRMISYWNYICREEISQFSNSLGAKILDKLK